MEATIIKIGNSKGLRLSKTVLEKYNFTDKVEIVLEQNQIIIKPIHLPRAGWDQAFKKMNQVGDDALESNDIFEDETFEEWK